MHSDCKCSFVNQNRSYKIFAKRKSDQILKIDLKIFRGIGHHNLFHFNVHNDIMSRKNVHSDYKFIISNKTDQIRFWKIKGLNYVHLIRSIVHLNSALCA